MERNTGCTWMKNCKSVVGPQQRPSLAHMTHSLSNGRMCRGWLDREDIRGKVRVSGGRESDRHRERPGAEGGTFNFKGEREESASPTPPPTCAHTPEDDS